MTSGVYCIKNKMNGKCYIGSSYNIEKRLIAHRKYLLANKDTKKLQIDWNAYGADAFLFEILELVRMSEILVCEQKWIDKCRASIDGYNTRKKAAKMLFSNNERKAR